MTIHLFSYKQNESTQRSNIFVNETLALQFRLQYFPIYYLRQGMQAAANAHKALSFLHLAGI